MEKHYKHNTSIIFTKWKPNKHIKWKTLSKATKLDDLLHMHFLTGP